MTELRYYAYGGTRYDAGGQLTSYRYTGQRIETGTGLYDYGARWYDPAIGRFLAPDTIVPEPGNPQALNRYAYVLNNPIRYDDPSGHCPMCITAAIGVVVGGGIAYGVQVAANISQNGLTVNALTEVNWATVGAGAVAGAVGGATFGVGTAVLGTGLAGTVASGAISGAVAGQAARATENVLSGREVTAGLGDPAQIVADAALGGALAGAGYGIGRLVRPAVAEATGETAERVVKIPAKQIRFTQSGISPNTRAGVPLDILTQEIESGYFRGTLRVVEYNGKLYSLDNRRLAAFKLLDRDVPVTLLDLSDPDVLREFVRKFDTVSDGLSIVVRGTDLVIR